MRCHFAPIGDDRYRCKRCGLTTAPTPYGPDKIHAECRAVAPLGFGDTLAELLSRVGFSQWWWKRLEAKGKTCGCQERQNKLNDVLSYPRWLRNLIAFYRVNRRSPHSGTHRL